MRRPAAVFAIVLALGAIILAPMAGAQGEGPTEIDKCQTISQPGSYKLVSNLVATGPGPGCLVITTDAVTIDLAGFSISRGAPGILAAPAPNDGLLQGIAVRNGSILNSDPGVDLSKAIVSIVEGLRVVIMPGPRAIGIIANGIVKGNTASVNGTGIIATGTVTGNSATGNAAAFEIGQGSTVIGNTALDSTHFGFVVSCPANLTDNTAVNNREANLVLNGEGCHNEDNVAP